MGTVDAPCAGMTDLFFSDDEDDEVEAKGICGGCPRRQECLLEGIRFGAVAGIWGGVRFPDELRAMRRLAARSGVAASDDDAEPVPLLRAEGAG